MNTEEEIRNVLIGKLDAIDEAGKHFRKSTESHGMVEADVVEVARRLQSIFNMLAIAHVIPNFSVGVMVAPGFLVAHWQFPETNRSAIFVHDAAFETTEEMGFFLVCSSPEPSLYTDNARTGEFGTWLMNKAQGKANTLPSGHGMPPGIDWRGLLAELLAQETVAKFKTMSLN